MFDYFFFDLDGTLTDPGIGITNSIIYSLEKMNIEIPERKELFKFIGPPLRDSYKKYYGMTAEDAEMAVSFYREHYSVTGLYENVLYDGITDVLKTLKANGKTSIVATSKPENFAISILEHFELSNYLDGIFGATLDEKRVTKADVIAYAIEKTGIKDKDRAVMIGDRDQDILGATENGISSAGVLYGYGTKEELSAAGCDRILNTVWDILNLQ